LPWLKSLRIYVLCSKTQNNKTSAQIRTYNAEDTFNSLNYRDQDLTFDLLVRIWKQRTRVGAAENPKAKPKKRTMTASKLTEKLQLIQADINVPEDTGSKIISKP
jgi:hypothetical protein